MNKKLGHHATEEIREAIRACMSQPEIVGEVARLAVHFGVNRNRIYEITRDLRPRRATRRDKGKRLTGLATNDALRRCAGWVLEYGLTPADAMLMAKERGIEVPVSLPTFTKYLREHGLDRNTLRRARRPHRRFEAAAPGEMFQFDISGTKERWYDVKTRKILSLTNLDVSKNHPNSKRRRVRIWRFVLTDDFSRKTFLRFYGCEKPSSSHVVDFLLQAYETMGVPLKLYTDNDAIIKFGRNKRAATILNKVLTDSGGYELLQHVPGNARATGKVERRHQEIEKFERFIGVYLKERSEPLTLELLNESFAPAAMNRYNNAVHRETGETPEARWQSRISLVRRLDYSSLKSAFLADEFDVRINEDLTFSFGGKLYQLPVNEHHGFARLRFSAFRQKVRIVFPDEGEYFTLIDDNEIEYDLTKTLAAPDRAGEFKSIANDHAEKLREELRKLVRDEAKEMRSMQRNDAEPPAVAGGLTQQTGATDKPQRNRDAEGRDVRPAIHDPHSKIPFFDNDFVPPVNSNIAIFPKREMRVGADELSRVAPVFAEEDHAKAQRHKETQRETDANTLSFWEAVNHFAGHFDSLTECKNWLDEIYMSREYIMPQAELENYLNRRDAETQKGKFKTGWTG